MSSRLVIYSKVFSFRERSNKTFTSLLRRNYSKEPNDGFAIPNTRRLKPNNYILLAIPITTFCLGTWQIQRRKWKLNLIKTLEEKTTTPPIDFPWDLDELKDLEYRRVRLKGVFHHDEEMYITPRSRVNQDSSAGGGLISSSASSGTWVVTPFTIADRKYIKLRGWVPKKKTLPNARPEGQISGEVELIGVVRHKENREPFMGKNASNSIYFHWRDVDAMAEMRRTEPVFLDAVTDSTVPGGPLGGQTRVNLRNEHFSYIITWYSLSAITAFLWYKRFVRRIPLM